MENTLEINKKLIEKCRQGDIKAQFTLYKKYSIAMYNIAIRFLNNKMDAEDVLQESFVTAFNRLSELKNDKVFGSWLRKIVTNNCISFVRKNKVYFEDINENIIDENENDYEIEKSSDPVVVHSAIKELPDGGRTILVLYALEGYKHREIADMLKISESTSRTQYRRALNLLSKKLKNKIYVN